MVYETRPIARTPSHQPSHAPSKQAAGSGSSGPVTGGGSGGLGVPGAGGSRPKLSSFASAPSWTQDDPNITHGFRRPTNSWLESLKSIWQWHNETMNIHSHLWPSLVSATFLLKGASTLLAKGGRTLVKAFTPPAPGTVLKQVGWASIVTPVYPFWSKAVPTVGAADTVAWGLFALGVTTCMAASALFHASTAHSKKVAQQTRCLDFLGIFIMGNSCVVPLFQNVFFCEPFLRNAYLGLMGTCCAVGVWMVCISEKYSGPQYRMTRTATFATNAGLTALPLVHAIVRYGWAEASAAMGARWIGVEIACFVLGALIYAKRFPESLAPGRFNCLGASHQLFHLLIVGAVASNFAAAGEGFRFRHGELAGMCPR